MKFIQTSFYVLIGFQQLSSAQASVEDLNSALGFDNFVNDLPEAGIQFLIPIDLLIGSWLGIKKLAS